MKTTSKSSNKNSIHFTFGFMDLNRSSKENEILFNSLRTIALTGFKREKLCSLDSFANIKLSVFENLLKEGLGKDVAAFRDVLYKTTNPGSNLKFPDIQSFFLHEFIRGAEIACAPLLTRQDKTEGYDKRNVDMIYKRSFKPIIPNWLENALNTELNIVENVFCDYQDRLIIPAVTNFPNNFRLLADIIAGSFLWAYIGGENWLKEILRKILSHRNGSTGMLSREALSDPQLCILYDTLSKDEIQQIATFTNIFLNNKSHL